MSGLAEQLQARIAQHRAAQPPLDLAQRPILIANLRFLHDCVTASEQLLVDAALAAQAAPQDAYKQALTAYYQSHLTEERGHLQWLRDDLKALNTSPHSPPDALAMALIGTQYYLIKHQHPAALLGYLAVVEGMPAPIQLVTHLEAIHGANTMRFIREHATKDLEHRIELFEHIDAAPQDTHKVITLAADSALECLGYAADMWRTHDHE